MNKMMAPILIMAAGMLFGTFGNDVARREEAAQIDLLVTGYQNRGLLNGTVLVAEKGRIIYRRAVGTANMDWDIPCGTDTKFHCFSISKQFTAMLGMMMVAEGKLRMDGTVADYLPFFRKDTGERIKVRHLFCHTHGIPYVSYNRLPYRNKLDKEAFFKAYYSDDLLFEPGTGFAYGDGFDVLAAIIEVVSGKPFESLMSERIFEPLNMGDTGFWHAGRNIRKMAVNYRDNLDSRAESLYEMPLNGSCALYSTVDDLYKWQRALMENRLLPRKYQDEMLRVQVDFGRPYGYGFDLSEVDFCGRKRKLVWHEGGNSALLSWVTEDDLLVILLNNVGGENVRVGREIMDILYGCSAEEAGSSDE